MLRENLPKANNPSLGASDVSMDGSLPGQLRHSRCTVLYENLFSSTRYTSHQRMPETVAAAFD
ncbi:hypothetical protein PILCRDRAFT_120683 [Piloderma croceum F 1598]|uniref:Uncharacterized protein n=1 Tax=Piloderma croceum (strain F 1598) TaxID=765440 RepID=A0A0C3G800_PILCF|nr:hypothetical protein PILCRDRAFT_120683 [Piloderma croceum F 1598]